MKYQIEALLPIVCISWFAHTANLQAYSLYVSAENDSPCDFDGVYSAGRDDFDFGTYSLQVPANTTVLLMGFGLFPDPAPGDTYAIAIDGVFAIGGQVPNGSTHDVYISLPVWGTGCNSVTNVDDQLDQDDCDDQTPCCGMPVWKVSQPFTSLWLHDEPLGYQPAAGPRVSFQLDFNQRESASETDTNIFSAGRNWNFSWLSYVTKDTNGTNVVLSPGGGQWTFLSPQNFLNNARLSGATNTGFTLSYPDGSKDVYGFLLTNSGGAFRKAFMTERWNAHSQKTALYYSGYNPANPVARLACVVDGDGRTNSLFYDSANTFSTNLISQIVDAFGRTNKMQYDNAGHLTNITDVAGISSAFSYDTNNWVSVLATPYGTTAFSITDSGTNVVPNGRSVLVTQPDGGHELYVYQDSAPGIPWAFPTNEIPNTDPFTNTLENADMNFRNTFYWGPRQYASLSTTNISAMTTNDFRKARLRHWLKFDYVSVGRSISVERDPSPDNGGCIEGQKTWYDYAEKVNTKNIGTQSRPLLTARVIPDGTTQFTRTDRNSFGSVTTNITTYSQGTTVLLRTNISTYASNDIDLLTTTNALGVQVSSNSYNTAHQVLTNYNALGEMTVYTYSASRELTSATHPSGLITTNIYDVNGLLATTYDYAVIGGSPVYYRTNSYTYTNDLALTHTDERGLTIAYAYDNLQRITNASDSRGVITYRFDKLDLVETVDRMGFTNRVGYDLMRRKVAETNALGRYTFYNYCTCGSLDSMQDAAGNVTYFFYDNQASLTNTLYPDGFSTTNRFNLLKQLASTSDSAGARITNWFNNQGLRVAVSNVFGRLESIGYDIQDRATNAVDANGVAVVSTFDNLDRPLSRSYPDGGVESFGYSPGISATTAYTNQLNNVTRYVYDPPGRKTAETNANLEVTQLSYSPASDLLALTDGKNQTTVWNYDQFGRATNKVDAASNVIFIYRYDANNRLTNRWTPAKGATAYSYDPIGNLTNIVYPVSTSISMAYDVLNRITNMVDSVGTTHYSYDAASQLLREDGPWDSDTLNYTYVNRLRTGLRLLAPNSSPWTQNYSYDAAKRLASVTSPAGEFDYAYDISRPTLPKKLTLPNGSYITNQYDTAARMLSTKLENSTNGVMDANGYTYNLAGQRTKILSLPSRIASYEYDKIGQLLSARAVDFRVLFPLGFSTPRLNEQFGYAYDAAGNLAYRTNNDLIQAFNVNLLNQLTTNSASGTVTVAGTTTSPATNVTVNTSNAVLYLDSTFASTNHFLANGNNTFAAIASDSYGRSSSDSITVNLPATNIFAYDLNGNLLTNGVQILDYDDENQLATNWVAGAWKSEFAYDGQHRRRIERDYGWSGSAWLQTNEIRFIYDGNVILQERDANNLPQMTLTRGLDLSGSLQGVGGIGGLLALSDNRLLAIEDSGAHSYYHADGNGNVTCLINTNEAIVARYLYDPFGNTLSIGGSQAWLNRHRFSSKPIHDVSGMYDFLRRWYVPDLQRWLNRDPAQEQGGMNLYTFVFDNPLNLIDRNGQAPSPSTSTPKFVTRGERSHKAGNTCKLYFVAIRFYLTITDAGNAPLPGVGVSESIRYLDSRCFVPVSPSTGSGITDSKGMISDDYGATFTCRSGYVSLEQTVTVGNSWALLYTIVNANGTWTGNLRSVFH